MSKLYEIDPYSDIKIPKGDLPEIIEICNYILNSSLLTDYKDQDEGNNMLNNLIQIAKDAIKMDVGLVSIGD